MNIKWFDIPSENFRLYGVLNDFTRLPREFASQISDGVYGNSACPAGGRVRFATNSKNVYIKAEMIKTRGVGFDLYRLENGGEICIAGFRRPEGFIFDGIFEAQRTTDSTDAEVHTYTLNFPYMGEIKALSVGIDEEARLEKPQEYFNSKPVVFYGSSITHGAWASRPGTTYLSMISQKYNLDYINMGFAGSALGEEKMINYMSDIKMSAFVCDYDHNAPDADYLKKTHRRVYEIIRDKAENVPYITVTKPDYYKNPEDSEMRRRIIYETYDYALRQGDKKVFFVDGKNLFDGEHYRNCTKDGCHPNDMGFFRMAEKIGLVIAKALNISCEKTHDAHL